MGDLQVINKALELGKFEASPVGLVVKGRPTYDEWAACGQVLSHIEKGRMWWIGDWLRYGEQTYGEMYSQALDETGYEYGPLRNAKWVCGQIELSRRRDNLSFAYHQEVASLSEEEQELWLNTAARERLSKQELREQIRQSKKLIASPLPKGTYNVIYADPPWPISTSVWDKWEEPIDKKYPLMPLEEIEALPIPKLSHDNSHLFLWTTLTFLPQALKLIETWGFQYHICLTWDKGHGFTLFGYYRNSELLLHAYKGKMLEDWEGEAFRTVFAETGTEHSTKPEIVYSLLEKRYPEPRIELFARRKRPGWKVWGNQV